MKTFRMLAWLTQLGISVVAPLVLCILVSVQLRNHFQLGSWVVLAGVLLGVGGAVSGLRSSLESMRRQADAETKAEDKPPPVSFNDHQ